VSRQHSRTITDALEQTRILKPDIITTDLHGGPRECCQLTETLKASVETRSIPVIAVTAWVKADDLERALHPRCDSVLPKPCRVDELLAEIHRLLPALHSLSPVLSAGRHAAGVHDRPAGPVFRMRQLRPHLENGADHLRLAR